MYILTFFFNKYNNFYSNHSIEKKLFLFKQVGNKHFNITKKYEKINQIINKTNIFENNLTQNIPPKLIEYRKKKKNNNGIMYLNNNNINRNIYNLVVRNIKILNHHLIQWIK